MMDVPASFEMQIFFFIPVQKSVKRIQNKIITSHSTPHSALGESHSFFIFQVSIPGGRVPLKSCHHSIHPFQKETPLNFPLPPSVWIASSKFFFPLGFPGMSPVVNVTWEHSLTAPKLGSVGSSSSIVERI